MKCPNCGNEVSQEEAFCGQCGTPNPARPAPSAQPTEMGNPSMPPRGGLLRSYNTPMQQPQPGSYPAGQQPGTYNTVPYAPGMPPPPGSSMPANVPPTQQVGPHQQSDFYQDATEAISALPGNSGPGYPMGYPRPGIPANPMQGNYPAGNQFGTQAQPLQPGNFAVTQYPPSPQFPTGQGYGAAPSTTPPPPKRQNNAVLVIAIVCLVIAILTVSAFGILYFLRGRGSPTANVTPTAAPASVPTAAPASTPTVGITPTPTIAPTDTPTAAPSPTPDPTAAPDPGFAWCGTTCTANGYNIEYPNGWTQSQTADSTGIQFTNPNQAGEFSAVKIPASVGGGNANDLVTTDLQTNYSKNAGYVPPTSTQGQDTTIGKQTWVYQTAYYQLHGQKARIVVYGIIYKGKGYIIELQAPDTLYETANAMYFQKMTGSFTFQ